jgi:hypothetical protein
MGEYEVRGYMVSTTAAFLRQTAAERGLPDPIERFSAPLRALLDNVVPVGLYPVAHVAELNRLIVSSLADNQEGRARTELANCGRFMANEATNTFMRLIMKVLTPSLFAKKLPDLWRRDCTHGKLELTVEDTSMTLGLRDMDGHDHIAAVMPGYVGFALEKMGKVIERISLDGWALEKPNGNGASIEFVWKK